MAAHLEGKGVVTQDAAGLAQKGGSTWSHIQIANRADAIYTTKVDMAKADLVIGCDPIVAATPTTLSVMQPGRTYVALNSHAAPTATFVGNPDWQSLPHAAPRRWPRPWAWRPGQLRRREGWPPPAGRQHLRQPHDAGLRLAKGPRAAEPRLADARHGAQRRAGGAQQGGL
jgi:hypothetical protein